MTLSAPAGKRALAPVDPGSDGLLPRIAPEKTPRVWSLIVTLFGDLAHHGRTDLAGTAVHDVMANVGIKPEAVRVALHRLRKDGWIDSEKDGRRTTYRLTSDAWAQSIAASPLIYGDPEPPARLWVSIADPTLRAAGSMPPGIPIAPGVRLGSDPPTGSDALVLSLAQSDAAPDWLQRQICPPELQRASQTLFLRLSDLARDAPAFPDLGPSERTALRMMIVHEWRRLALRIPVVHATLFPEDWQGRACRSLAQDLLARLPCRDGV